MGQPRGYDGMPLAADSTYLGAHYETTGLVAAFENVGLIRADSMDIINDPRFFNDNVLNYRLAAFSGLSVVSGLLVQNCMNQLFDMSKQMIIFNSSSLVFSVNGILQLASFMLLMYVLFSNVLAVYIGVAQPYHTMRLMTAGPTGFDAAASYYLNKNIVSWRHIAIKGMLQSIPIYIFQMGLRMVVKFDRDTKKEVQLATVTPMQSMIQGIVFCIIMQLLAITLYWVHVKHFNIFRDRYEVMTELIKPMQGFMHQQMMPRAVAAASRESKLFAFLDV
jgi:hypothetical protein